MTTQCPWKRILTSEPRFDWDVSDRGRRRQGKLLFKKWICVFSTFIAIIPTHLYCRMYAHSFGIEFLRALLKFKKKKVWCTCKIVLLLIKPIGFLKFSFRIVYGTKIFKPKIIGGYPTENIFPEIVNPREHSTLTGDEGKKPSDKKIIQQKTHKKSKFRCRKRRNWNI